MLARDMMQPSTTSFVHKRNDNDKEDGTPAPNHNPRYETENTNIKLRYNEREDDNIDIIVADNVDDLESERSVETEASATSSMLRMREIQNRSTTNKSARRGSSSFFACCCGT